MKPKVPDDAMGLALAMGVGVVLCAVGITLVDPLFVEEVTTTLGGWLEAAFSVLP